MNPKVFSTKTARLGMGILLFLNLLLASDLSATVRYVKPGGAGAGTGADWANASANLQAMIDAAGTTQVWVAAGTYQPTSGTDRSISFVMKDGVAILGGFPNTGDPGLADRNWAANLTTLSGEIGAAGNGDNSAHVVLGTGTNATAVLDGFIVTKGNTAGAGAEGAGLYLGDGSSPTVTNCIFSENSATYGGAVYVRNNCTPSFTNCAFQANTATLGSAILTEASSTTSLTNCTFSGNTADNATISNQNSGNSTIKNCIIWGNTGGSIVGNSIVTYSIVQGGGYSGTGNLNVDPLFVSTTDLHIQQCSQARDAGTATGAPATDYDGDARPQGNGIDMGFDEYTGASCCPSGNVFYVKANANGANNGSSWANAFTDLQSALNSTCPNLTQIWVAAGTYKPTSDTDRNISFVMKDGVAILGGFPNTGDPGLADRNWAANLTTLSGEIGAAGNGDNSYHVIFNNENGLNSTAVLDGFTITGGNANGNFSNSFGGGMANRSSSPTVTNCSFSGNSADLNGGGMNNISSSPTVTNCSFSGNSATISGGGLNNGLSAFPTFTNCTISGNYPNEVRFSAGYLTFTNCIIWGGHNLNGNNSNITHSIIQGGHPGTGNLNVDPLFVSSTDLHIQQCSPARDAGTATGAPATDYDGDARPQGSGIDMGFDEYTGAPCCPSGNVFYVKANANGANDGSSWANAFTDLQSALNSTCPGFSEIWVAAGTYKPTSGTVRNISFVMKNGVAILGGFPNTGNPGLSDRDWTANVTTLSGDIGTVGDNSDNSYHVIYNSSNGLNSTAILDGFTIALGNALGAPGSNENGGGGMRNFNSSPAIVNCIFSANAAEFGGGILNINDSSPTITNCAFTGNSANTNGGALNNFAQSGGVCNPVVTNCSFSANSAIQGGAIFNFAFAATVTPNFFNCTLNGNNADFGGGMLNSSSSPNVTNCSFSGNSATFSGGGLSNGLSSFPTFTNCTISGNSPSEVTYVAGYPAFTNCIIWGLHNLNGNNSNITHSIIQGGHPGSGNLNVDPLFVNTTDLHIQQCSPARDAGTAAGAPATDYDGDARPQGSGIDMGFDEYTGAPCCPSGNVFYVKANANGANNGTSWANAFTDLQSALNSTCPGFSEIWVAAGTYKPTSGTDRNISFVMKNGVAILGGFPNTGNPGLADRNWGANLTTLSGDIGNPGNSDNSYHVVLGTGTNATAILDGFTVTKGNIVGSARLRGGGLYLGDNSSLIVNNCIFSENNANYGGAVYVRNNCFPSFFNCVFQANGAEWGGGIFTESFSSPSLTNCSFASNSASSYGGGMFNFAASPNVTNCSFSGNSANNEGGGMFNNASLTTVTNCSFSGNSAGSSGGGMYNDDSSPSVTNCSFSGNSAGGLGGGMANFYSDSSPTLTNCILWGNSSEIVNNLGGNATVTYSIVQQASGVYPGMGNMNVDPLFVQQPPIGLGTTGDLHLQTCSPARDAGTATGAPATDYDGDTRPQGNGIDMGFDENSGVPCCPSGNVFYVKANANGANNGSSWANAFTDLQSALNSTCPNLTQIWVAAGTYKPTSGTDRNISFVMKNGVAILGGFPSTGNPGLADRNWTANLTTLSGDIGAAGNGDNSKHVIYNNNGLNNTAVLDGFTIMGGNANGNNFPDSYGGGMANLGSSPTVTNCSFSGNSATFCGGGMYNFNSSPSVTNCSFSGNSATFSGGGMYNFSSSPSVTNCSFSGNSAGDGGGVFNDTSSFPTFMNCTISGNSPNEVKYVAGYPAFTNCIIWGGHNLNGNNSNITHSIIQGGHPGTGNLNVDPLFVSSTDLHIQQCSPAREAGTATGAPATDYDGDARPQGSGIDLGFDEYTGAPCCPAGNVFYVKANANGANNGSSWANAFTDLQSALNNTCPGITQIWVAAGTYKPTSGTDRNISYVMKNGVATLGGFPNTGNPGLTDRNWTANVTTLSGDIGNPGNSDNSHHVVLGTGSNATAILDGFTVTKGNTVGSIRLRGGGLYLGDNSSLIVNNCIFSENNAKYGGAVYVRNNCFPSFTNCAFQANMAILGSAILTEASSTTNLTNCTFSGNTADIATISNQNSGNSTIKNCIIWGNAGGSIEGNSTATYSIVQGGYTGTGNLNVDPLFVNTTDLHIQQCSPARDAGTAAGAPATDYDGDARPQGSGIDMGFDEFVGPPITFTLPVNGGSTVACPALANQQPTPPAVTNTCGTAVVPTGPVITNNPNPVTCEGTRAYVYTYAGNNVTLNWSFTYTIEREPFTITTPNGSATVACPALATPPATLPTVMSACGETLTPSTPAITNAPNPLTCEGMRTYAYTYTDCEGNTATWGFVYTIEREPFTVPANGSATVACPALATPPTALPTVTSACGETLTPTGPTILNTPNPLTCEGTRRYSYVYTDCEGNTKTWRFTYTIERQPFTVPANGTATVACPALAIAPATLPTVTSACGETLTPSTPAITNAPNPLTCEGTRTYTYTYTDCEGNTATWSYVYTIERGPFTISTTNGSTTVACPALATPPATLPTVTSACGETLTPSAPVITNAPNPLTCEGTRTYAYTYTDCENNTAVWSFTYTIERQPFTISTPNGSTTVACPALAIAPATLPTVTSACGETLTPTGPTILNTPNPLTCEGTRRYSYVYTDCEGNTKTWRFTYTIERQPFTVPANGTATVSCPASATAPTPPAVQSACGETLTPTGPTILNTPNPLTCEGTRRYSYVYTDCEGNTATWSFVYTIEREPFTIGTPNGAATVACPALAVAPTPPAVQSACGETLTPTGPTILNTPNPLTCEGTRRYSYVYTDCEGNTATWSYTYTIERQPFSIATPNGSATVSCPALATAPTPPTVQSACGETLTPTGPTILNTPNPLTCEGTRRYSYVYTDCEGNTATWSFVYTIEREPFTISTTNGSATVACPALATPPATLPTVISACGETLTPGAPVVTNAPNPLTCEGTRTYAYTYTDCEGNTATWSYVFTIERELFTISTPNGSATVSCPALATAPTPPTVQSACGETLTPSAPVVTNTPNPLTCEGTRTYAYTYTDCEGNTAVWSYTYTIEREPFTISTPNGSATVACPALATAPTAPTVQSACGETLTPSAPVVTNTPNPLTCEGTRTYAYTYTDCEGNTAVWSYTYTIEREPFTIGTPNGSATVACPALATAPTPPTVQSACGETLTPSAPVVTNTPNPLTCEGTRTYAYTYTDCEGNTAVWSYTYTIEREPFTISTPNGSATVACPALAIAPTPPTVTSACGETIVPSGPVILNNPNPLICEGTRSYTWTYTDCEGNSQPWAFTYTIEHQPFAVPTNGSATVSCPAQANVQPTPPTITSNCGEVLMPVVTSSAPLGCEGNQVWYFAYTDCEGNTATWLFTYTVEYPDFSLPPSVTQDFECPINEGTPTPPTIFDGCGRLLNPTGPVITGTQNAQGCEASRTYTWTYQDCEGNSHTWGVTRNFQYEADFTVPQDEVNHVGCLSHAVPPVPQTLYDICGLPIAVSGPEVTELPGGTDCSGTRVYTFVYTDCGGHSHPWTFTVHAADEEPPTGSCTGLEIDGLSCAEEVPCPDGDFSGAIAQLLANGNFEDLCSGADLVVTLDSWTELSACNDDDGDGSFTFSRTYYFSIADPCGNEFPELCPVTYSGVCQPIGTLPPAGWGGSGLSSNDVQQLFNTYGPLVIGGTNASLTVNSAACLAQLVPGGGLPGPLGACHQVACQPGCNPMGEGGLANTLATNAIALQLSLWMSASENNLPLGTLGGQGLGCIKLDPSLVSCGEQGCQLHIFGQGGVEHAYPYTVAGLMAMANDFLGGDIVPGPAASDTYSTALAGALQTLLDYYEIGGQPQPGGCGEGAGANGPEGAAEKAIAGGGAVPQATRIGFTMAPNPASREVSLVLWDMGEECKVSLEIHNGFGQLVLRREFGTVGSLNERVDLDGLNSGMYFVVVKAGGERYEQKLVIGKD